MKIESLGISNFRSIGEEAIWINLTKKITIVVGENNSGKSNLLWGVVAASQSGKQWDEVDFPQMDTKQTPSQHIKYRFEPTDNISNIFDDDIVSITFVTNKKGGVQPKEFGQLSTLDENNKLLVAKRLFNKTYDGFYPVDATYDAATRDLFSHFGQPPHAIIPSVEFIPQFRQIKRDEKYLMDGTGVIELLASWDRPEITKQKDEKKFKSIEELLKRLLNIPELELRVDHKKDTIQIKHRELLLPLSSYGTGVHELIILAVAVQQVENRIICIEEPEIHLHPRLQKVFLKYLIEETNNKYIISTHSSSLIQPGIDTEVVHVRAEDGVTVGQTIRASRDALRILHDLGVKASDILQTNCVIWVEGPSDRVYINRWLFLANNELVEGIHYQIMFYGGHLRSHLSMEPVDPERVCEFIPLLLINQNSVFVMDSDKEAEGDKINESKERIKVECEKHELFCWITEGREIENYLSSTQVSKAYNKLTEQNFSLTLSKWEKIEKPIELKYGDKLISKWKYGKNKPDMSRLIIDEISDLSECQYDLKHQIEKLVEHILKANHNEI